MKNPTGNKIYCGLQPLPSYDYRAYPFVLVRDMHSVSLVNVKKEQITVIVDICRMDLREIERASLMAVAMEEGTINFYCAEVESVQVDRDRYIANSTIKKYTITEEG